MKAARVVLGLMAIVGCGPAAPAPVELRIEATKPPGPGACVAGDRWDGTRCVAERAAPGGTCPPGTALVAGGTLLEPDVKPITVRSVCMDVTEVTTGAYVACVRKGRCDTERLDADAACNHNRRDRYDHPINCVSWEQADRYCRAEGKRLPSVEEWVWAAQGRSAARKYPWGDAPPTEQLCWSNGAARKGTCPVGSFPNGRSPQGIDDLVGNVWEWASPKVRNGVANVTGAASWQNNDAVDIHRENSGNFESDFERNDVVGFRCVMDAPAAEKRD
jgi:formylglycine-generating enzyme required for sulfatase activity